MVVLIIIMHTQHTRLGIVGEIRKDKNKGGENKIKTTEKKIDREV